MLRPAGAVADCTQVVVRALWASEAVASLNLQATAVADTGKGWSIRVVQVVQHHCTAVLRSPDGVKLVVVALTQRQESLQTQTQIPILSQSLASLDMRNAAI